VSYVEHLLIAETGTDEQSRYAVMAGVRLEDPAAAEARLRDTSDESVIEVLRGLAFEIRIVFASKQRIEAIGEDWRYGFLYELAAHTFDSNRQARRIGGYRLIAHLEEGRPFDFDWLGAYLTNASYSQARVHTRVLQRGAPLMALPALVARLFHGAVQEDRGRPSAARERYDALAPLIKHVEDLGFAISYAGKGTDADSIVRAGLST
jgi:hypothetical protein